MRRIAAVVLILLVAAALINAMRGGEGFALPQVLPFLGGQRPAIYELAGVILLVITAWGLARLYRRKSERH